MDKILTDPELVLNSNDQYFELQTLRKKNLKMTFLESENASLWTKITDLQTTVAINKEIIGALIDSVQSAEYQTTFQIFQREIKNQMDQALRYAAEKDSLQA